MTDELHRALEQIAALQCELDRAQALAEAGEARRVEARARLTEIRRALGPLWEETEAGRALADLERLLG